MIPTRNIRKVLKKALAQPGYAFSAAKKRMMGLGYYHLANGTAGPPGTISIFATYKCNLHCSVCGQWGVNGSSRQLKDSAATETLPLSVLQSLIDDVAAYSPNITLFGGEPTLYPHWLDVVIHAKKQGLRCNMVTNGSLIEPWIDDIVRHGMDEIIVSIDGPEVIHDTFRNVKGTFSKSVNAFQKLHAAKKRAGVDRPLITVNSTVFEKNHDCLEALIPIAESIGTNTMTIHHLLFLSADEVAAHAEIAGRVLGIDAGKWPGFIHTELPAIDVDVLIEKMRKIARTDTPVNVQFYPNLTEAEVRRYYTAWDFTSTSYANRCLSPWLTAYIFPDGSVQPYHSMGFVAGNIKEQPFSSIWNNDAYRTFRRAVKEHKMFPVCAKGCTELYRY